MCVVGGVKASPICGQANTVLHNTYRRKDSLKWRGIFSWLLKKGSKKDFYLYLTPPLRSITSWSTWGNNCLSKDVCIIHYSWCNMMAKHGRGSQKIWNTGLWKCNYSLVYSVLSSSPSISQVHCVQVSIKDIYIYTVGKISIWTPADFASLATCKEMCDL